MKNTINLIHSLIKNRLNKLDEDLDNLPLDEDFAYGYKQAILDELKFLQNLVETFMLELETKEV